jgi:hypothetical protein
MLRHRSLAALIGTLAVFALLFGLVQTYPSRVDWSMDPGAFAHRYLLVAAIRTLFPVARQRYQAAQTVAAHGLETAETGRMPFSATPRKFSQSG